MRRSVPKFVRMVETPSEGGGDDAPDVVEEVDAPEVSDDEDSDDNSEVWDKDRALAKIRKSNQEAKAQRERAKAAEEKAAQAGDAEARAVKAEARLMRVEQAVALGLPLELADRLQGDTPEEIAQDAEALLALFASKQPPTNKPKPHLVGGATPTSEVDKDARSIVEEALRR